MTPAEWDKTRFSGPQQSFRNQNDLLSDPQTDERSRSRLSGGAKSREGVAKTNKNPK